MNNPTIPRRMLLVLAGLGLACVLLELGARAWLVRFAGDDAFRKYASVAQLRRQSESGTSFTRYLPHRHLGHAPTPGFTRAGNRHNALGYRGEEISSPKPDGEYRIVCLGGSTTYTPWVESPAESYPARMQARLHERGYTNVRVVNGGVEGYSSFETLVNFEFRVLDLEPDMVVVYHGVNDVTNRVVWPPEAYRGDNSGHLRHSPAWDAPVPLWDRSTVLRILRIRLGYAYSPLDLVRTFGRFSPSAFGWAFLFQKMHRTYPDGIFLEHSVAEMLRASPPRYFERNLTNLVVMAKHHGIEPVLATFAYRAVDDGGWDGTASPEYVAAMDEQNALVERLAAELDVAVFDFAEAFPDDEALFTGSVHMTVDGARLKGRLFADFLVDAGLVARPR